jgi:hypothetical protein
MGYQTLSGVHGSSDGSDVITAIRGQLTAAGWSNSSNVFTKTTDGTTLTVNVAANAFGANGDYTFTLNGTSVVLGFGAAINASHERYVEICVLSDFFWVKVVGPTPAQRGNVYGSPASSVMLTRYVPISADQLTDKSKHWAVTGMSTAGLHDESTPSPWAYSNVRHGFQGTGSVVYSELATIRPTIQDVLNVGDLLPSKAILGGIVYWPFVIVNSTEGVVGRLRNVFFGGETYALTGDLAANLHNDAEVYINGTQYKTTTPHAYPTTDSTRQPYTAFGATGGPNNVAFYPNGPLGRPSGPYIVIRSEE